MAAPSFGISATKSDTTAVFLNVPFDARYEPLFLALIASLISIGRKPWCVLEIPDVLLESVRHRLAKTLSDMAGFDPVIHMNCPRRLISGILDSLGTGASDPAVPDVYRMWKQLMKAARQLKKSSGQDDIYSRSLFRKLVAAGTELSVRCGFIPR